MESLTIRLRNMGGRGAGKWSKRAIIARQTGPLCFGDNGQLDGRLERAGVGMKFRDIFHGVL